ncbi:imidazole glycerol phosphate synthase subunit HisH [Buchnera aphidicola]|uniref:imidazole glycerol phosphate synthase subunit HisH n=1 Tax=Buchnera aphidicola TaxID=9 RepID=UPI003464079D
MNIVIIDTGCANLYSLKYAVQRLGYQPIITREINLILNADKLFLPGVGTPKTAMEQLYLSNLIKIIKSFKNPILGICLGMQLLCSYSQECRNIKMLDIIHSLVSKFKVNHLSIPHTGWNNIIIDNDNQPLFNNISNRSKFYFVHSYAVEINKYTLATSYYGVHFSAVIKKNNFFGVQFHPEKSGISGAQLLKNFLEI